jgi:predicted transposase YbfD/YdcC
MGCQTDIAKTITKKQADYVLAVKGNQGTLHEDIQDFFTDAYQAAFKNVEYDYYEDVDAGHGRIEQRQCWTVDAKKYRSQLCTFKHWHKLNSIIMIKTTRQLKNKTTHDTRYYISSAKRSAQIFGSAVRQHWGVENSLHWTLDVTFREDECRIRKGASPENLAIIRYLVHNMIRKNTSIEASVKRKRAMAGLDDSVRHQLMHFDL